MNDFIDKSVHKWKSENRNEIKWKKIQSVNIKKSKALIKRIFHLDISIKLRAMRIESQILAIGLRTEI
jgi:hypothetical protein